MIHTPDAPLSPYYIAKMTFGEIAATITGKPAIILPLSGLEPCTEYGSLGAAALCCFSLANNLSEKKSILLAPMVPYGYSVAFKAFAGSAAVSRKTMAAYLFDVMRSWAQQGITVFIIIDAAFDNADSISWATKRLLYAHKETRCEVLNWHQMSEVRSFIAQKYEGAELGYSQVGLLSMAAFLDAGYVRPQENKKAGTVAAGPKDFLRWRKMGQDPSKLRKMFPDACMSFVASHYSAEFGRELFFLICKSFESAITRELHL